MGLGVFKGHRTATKEKQRVLRFFLHLSLLPTILPNPRPSLPPPSNSLFSHTLPPPRLCAEAYHLASQFENLLLSRCITWRRAEGARFASCDRIRFCFFSYPNPLQFLLYALRLSCFTRTWLFPGPPLQHLLFLPTSNQIRSVFHFQINPISHQIKSAWKQFKFAHYFPRNGRAAPCEPGPCRRYVDCSTDSLLYLPCTDMFYMPPHSPPPPPAHAASRSKLT